MMRLPTTIMALLLATVPAVAQTAAIDPLLDLGACYARRYDAAHLKAHPAQRVTSVSLVRSKGEPGVVTVGLALTRAGRHYEGQATCRGGTCTLEADGGSFTLAPTRDGLRLAVGSRMELEGDMDFMPDLARSVDDRVFLLPRAPAGACRR